MNFLNPTGSSKFRYLAKKKQRPCFFVHIDMDHKQLSSAAKVKRFVHFWRKGYLSEFSFFVNNSINVLFVLKHQVLYFIL